LYDINWNRIHTSTILKQFPLFALLLLVSHLSLNLNAKALNNSKNIKPEIRANLIANGLTAPLGGLMGYTSLSRSQLNLNCGATSKLSSILAGTICLGSLVLFPEMISYIPRPILSALIFYMGLQLFLKHLWTQHPSFSLLFNFFTWSVLGIFITLRFIHPSELEQYIPDLDSHHLSKQLERWLDEV
jgi:MFS superfamily sulfate permease-like transporter